MTGVSARESAIRIGTSGWHYDHWIGRFYPPDRKQGALLDFYVERFDSVEINNTFYRLPGTDMLADWRDRTPEGFLFACKGSRFITHMKKLKDPEQSYTRFFDAVDTLGRKLGPILFQLPPKWRVNVERLQAFLDALPPQHRYAFEFRDPTWLTQKIYDVLEGHGAALCIYDLDGRTSPVEVTADFVYVRLHGPGGPYRGDYDGRTLFGWARRLSDWRDAGRDAFCYFDNDENAYAAFNAARLRDMVERN